METTKNNVKCLIKSNCLSGDTRVSIDPLEIGLFEGGSLITLEKTNSDLIVIQREICKILAVDLTESELVLKRAFESCVQTDLDSTRTLTNIIMDFNLNDTISGYITEKIIEDLKDEEKEIVEVELGEDTTTGKAIVYSGEATPSTVDASISNTYLPGYSFRFHSGNTMVGDETIGLKITGTGGSYTLNRTNLINKVENGSNQVVDGTEIQQLFGAYDSKLGIVSNGTDGIYFGNSDGQTATYYRRFTVDNGIFTLGTVQTLSGTNRFYREPVYLGKMNGTHTYRAYTYSGGSYTTLNVSIFYLNGDQLTLKNSVEIKTGMSAYFGTHLLYCLSDNTLDSTEKILMLDLRTNSGGTFFINVSGDPLGTLTVLKKTEINTNGTYIKGNLLQVGGGKFIASRNALTGSNYTIIGNLLTPNYDSNTIDIGPDVDYSVSTGNTCSTTYTGAYYEKDTGLISICYSKTNPTTGVSGSQGDGNIRFLNIVNNIITLRSNVSGGTNCRLIPTSIFTYGRNKYLVGNCQQYNYPAGTYSAIFSIKLIEVITPGTIGGYLQGQTEDEDKLNFIGISKSVGFTGDMIELETDVYETSGLIPGNLYYIGNNGTIATSPGTNTKIIGKALNETDLKILY